MKNVPTLPRSDFELTSGSEFYMLEICLWSKWYLNEIYDICACIRLLKDFYNLF